MATDVLPPNAGRSWWLRVRVPGARGTLIGSAPHVLVSAPSQPVLRASTGSRRIVEDMDDLYDKTRPLFEESSLLRVERARVSRTPVDRPATEADLNALRDCLGVDSSKNLGGTHGEARRRAGTRSAGP